MTRIPTRNTLIAAAAVTALGWTAIGGTATASTASASTASANTSNASTTGADLVITEGVFEEVYEFGGHVVLGLAYTMVNIGDAATDLGGADGADLGDNVSIQTYLSTTPDLTGTARAAGGGVIQNPVVLGPGGTYGGMYFSNSAQLPDPLDLSAFPWLVVEIVSTDEPVPALANNLVGFAIPTPCGRADRAAPIGELDLADVTRFVEWFTAGDEAADFNSDGLFSLEDVVAFVETFLAGC